MKNLDQKFEEQWQEWQEELPSLKGNYKDKEMLQLAFVAGYRTRCEEEIKENKQVNF